MLRAVGGRQANERFVVSEKTFERRVRFGGALVRGFSLSLGLALAACSASSGTKGGGGALGSGAVTSYVPGAGSQGSNAGGFGAAMVGGDAGNGVLTLGM